MRIYCVSMLETPSMKREGLQYFQSLPVKEQATEKTFLDMREVKKYILFNKVRIFYLVHFLIAHGILYRILFFLVL
jgi:hypothetical protein